MDRLEEALFRLLSYDPVRLQKRFEPRVAECGRVEPPVVIRLDGVRFSKALEGFERPRDARVHSVLVDSAVTLMKRFGASLGFVGSDEVSIFVPRVLPYGGRLYKVVSVASGLLSSHVSLGLGRPVFFDARVIPIAEGEVYEYIIYRARVTVGNLLLQIYVNKYGRSGVTPRITSVAKRVLDEFRAYAGIAGTVLVKSVFRRESVNRLTGERVVAERSRIEKFNVLDYVYLLTGEGVRGGSGDQ